MAPTLYSAVAEEWIASNASVLNLRFVAMTNPHPIIFLNQPAHLLRSQRCVSFNQPAKIDKLIVRYIGPIPLGE